MRRLKELAKSIAAEVREHIASSVAPLGARLDGLENAVAELPASRNGIDGDPGERGEKGDPGPAGKDGRDGADGKDGAPGPAGEKGEKGDSGPAGKDGLDGVDGKDGAPGASGEKGEKGDPGPAGRDGGNGVDGKDGARGLDGKDGRDGRDGKDGESGRDALAVVPLDGIDPAKTYPRGTWAFHRGGTICALRATDPIGEDGLLKAGWAVAMEGIFQRTETWIDEGREVETLTEFTSGRRHVDTIITSMVRYRGVYKDGTDYRCGDLVTWGGSVWHCEVSLTSARPDAGNADWKLAVKRGANGRDGLPGKDARPAITAREGAPR